MSRSEAQKRADEIYRKSGKYNRVTIGANVRKEEAVEIQNAANAIGLTASRFLLLSAQYCIDNNIDLFVNQRAGLDKTDKP